MIYSIGEFIFTDYIFQLFGNLWGIDNDHYYMNLEKDVRSIREFDGVSRGKAPYLMFIFKLGNSKVIQARRVYSLLDFGSDIGGLYGVIQPIFTILAAFFVGPLFTSNLVT